MSLTMTESRPVAPSSMMTTTTAEQEIERLTLTQLDSSLAKLCYDQDAQMATLLHSIVQCLQSHGNDGATLIELKRALAASIKFTDEALVSAVHLITNVAIPPLAVSVGFGDARLVLATELDIWTIQPSKIQVPSVLPAPRPKRRKVRDCDPTDPDTIVKEEEEQLTLSDDKDDDNDDASDEETMAQEDTSDANHRTKRSKRSRPNDFYAVSSDRQEELKQGRKDVIKPLMWNDINGHTLEPIWKSCLDVVVEALMNRPGVTFGHLCRSLSTTLLPLEISALLTTLAQWGAIRHVVVSTGGSSSLFKSDRPPLCTMPDTAIDASRQTSYWLVPGFYNQFPHLK